MPKHNKNHCVKCGSDIKIVTRRASVVFNCLECRYRIPTFTKICKKHGDVGFKKIILPETNMKYKCQNCGYKKHKKSSNIAKYSKRNDNLFIKLKFDRRMINAIRGYDQNGNAKHLIDEFLYSVSKFKKLDALDEFIFPRDLVNEILDNTECDKFVEKSTLRSVVYWFFSTFMSGNLEQLAINAVSNNSQKNLSRSLTNDSVISANALGERLGNENRIAGLEQLLQVCIGRKGTRVFSEEETLKPVYYDWMYIVKSGETWKVCAKMPHSDNFHGFKVGVGADWIDKSIVSLVFHGEKHPNDNVSFQRDLCINDIPSLINITDRGPFDSHFMQLISRRSQYFIIRLKSNLKYSIVHMKKKNRI